MATRIIPTGFEQYPAKRHVLSRLRLSTIKSGSMFAIVGRARCGKTTALQNLLESFPVGRTIIFDPTVSLISRWDEIAGACVYDRYDDSVVKYEVQVQKDVMLYRNKNSDTRCQQQHQRLNIVVDGFKAKQWPDGITAAMNLGHYLNISVFVTATTPDEIPSNLVQLIDVLLTFNPYNTIEIRCIHTLHRRFFETVCLPYVEFQTLVRKAWKCPYDAFVLLRNVHTPARFAWFHAQPMATEPWRQHTRVSKFRDELIYVCAQRWQSKTILANH